jgi:membrane protein YqaA with SNARE-associated domain
VSPINSDRLPVDQSSVAVGVILVVFAFLGLGIYAATPAPGSDVVAGWFEASYDAMEEAVRTATGWPGMAVVFVYSFLIAFVLPLPSEIVLAAPLQVGLPHWVEIGVIMLVSGTGKAAGSVFAFHLGQEAKQAGPIIRWLRRSRFDVVEWSESKTILLAREFGYVGLAGALCVPGFPDTVSIYAFSVLEENYYKFAAATFVGSVGRLVVFVGLLEAVLVFV